jgi:GNAT superfamily N-acetyltransferase
LTVDLTLDDFREEHAATILGWVRSAEDALTWAETPFLRIGPELFEEWHAPQGVVPCVGLLGDAVCAYGQILEDQVEREAEIARVIVRPDLRGNGVGRAFVLLLAVEARRRGLGVTVARIARRNRAGYACFHAAGFTRLTAEDEAALNLDEPEEYVWMQFGSGLTSGG